MTRCAAPARLNVVGPLGRISGIVGSVMARADFRLLGPARIIGSDGRVVVALAAHCRELLSDPDLTRLEPDVGRLAGTVMTAFFHGVLPRGTSGPSSR